MATLTAIFSAIMVGVPLIFLQRPQHRCVSTLAIAGEPTARQLERYRLELLDHARQHFAGTDELGPTSRRWFVDALGQRQLRLGADFSDPQRGIAEVRNVAESYCQRMAQQAAGASATRTEAEIILDERRTSLQKQYADVRDRRNDLQAALPKVNPTDEHLALLDHWDTLFPQFGHERQNLDDARQRVQTLEARPPAQDGEVTQADRDRAYTEDLALTQDLRELEVNLTELKLHLLNVWQVSAGPLEPLMLSVDDMLSAVSPGKTADVVEADQPLIDKIREHTKAYQELLTKFEKTWHREFTALRAMEVDPQRDAILDSFRTVRSSLRDFLFNGSNRLADLRTSVRSFNLGPADNARYHVLRSNLTRSYQAIQTAHQKFEFASGSIETPENFRLDAALLSARGLRRRTRERIANIEKRLQAAAVDKARAQQRQELTEAKDALAQQRLGFESVVGEMAELQARINDNAKTMASYNEATRGYGIAQSKTDLLSAELDSLDGQLQELKARREAAAESSHVTVVSCKSLGSTANLRERIRVAAMAACLTFLVVFLGQWVTGRR